MPRTRARVTLVLADEPLTGQAVVAALRASNVIEAECQPDWRSACRAISEGHGDALLWIADDLDEEALERVRALREAKPHVGVCLLARRLHLPCIYALAAERASGLSVLLRTDDLAITDVVRGLMRLDAHTVTLTPEVLEAIAQRASSDDDEPFSDLSPDERAVLELLAMGLRNCAIARRMHRSEKVIEKRIGAIFSKLNLNNGGDRTLDRRVTAARVFLAHRRELDLLEG